MRLKEDWCSSRSNWEQSTKKCRRISRIESSLIQSLGLGAEAHEMGLQREAACLRKGLNRGSLRVVDLGATIKRGAQMEWYMKGHQTEWEEEPMMQTQWMLSLLSRFSLLKYLSKTVWVLRTSSLIKPHKSLKSLLPQHTIHLHISKS